MTNTSNPRKHFSNIKELAQNISEVGLIQPIAVRAVGEMYRLICGHRRLLAVKSLGWSEIPGNIFESDGSEDDWWMLSENLQRSDLSEVEKAEKLHEMIGHQSLSTRKIADKLGLNQGYVVKLLQVHGYPEEVKESIKSKAIGADTVRSINKLETPEEQIKVVSYAVDNELNRKQVDEAINIIKDLPPPIRSKLTDEPEYTVSHAVAECIVETEDEYYDGVVDYKTTKESVMNCKNILKSVNYKVLNVTEKTILRGELGLLKVQLDNILRSL